MHLTLVEKIFIYAIPLIFAITVHEAAHGYVARHFGDPTADERGRISLNPLRHIDPVGTLLLPLLLYITTKGAFSFGWAKPVPVDFSRLRKPKEDMLWVAAAGPFSNLVMAILWGGLMHVMLQSQSTYAEMLVEMALAGITVNVILMVLNLLPMPPLDGGRIAVSLLPMNLATKLASVERFGLVIMIVLSVTGVLSAILSPIVQFFRNIIVYLFLRF
jgi:Zn-dependent protease